jgi:TetR/AcrR family transcriptional repressor of nem operon
MHLWDYVYNLLMRYQRGHKERTHHRIVTNAARQFRAKGLARAGLAHVMQASGLTVGGFYKHFRSKEDLLTEALAQSLRETRERILAPAREAPAGEAWKEIVRTYLSLEHCEHAEVGCPIAALAADMSRTKPAVKKKIAGLIAQHRDEILPFVPGRNGEEKQKNFIIAMTAMAGAVALARTMIDPSDKQRVLDTVRDRLLESV